jgi:RHS repeat-associated protein
VGNRTALTDTSGTQTYSYDAANRLTHVDGITYTWDMRGNLTNDGVYTYTYDGADRMVQAQNVTLTLVYTYNADGLRVAQDLSGTVTAFVWDWATPVPELVLSVVEGMSHDGDNVYLVGLDTVGWWDGEAWAFALPDALGSVRQTADITGAVTANREWSPFGVTMDGAQAGLGYTGEWWDDGAGLLYLRARWYDSVVGRFTQLDPWSGNFTRPGTLNGFSYVLNNPVQLIDPSGLCESDPYDPYYDYECWVLAREISELEGGGYAEYSRWNYEGLETYLFYGLKDTIKREASRFGLPPEFLAAVIAAEVRYDTDWINSIYDVWTTLSDWLHPDDHWSTLCLYKGTLIPLTGLNLDLWHHYYGFDFYLNPEHGFGEGPAPGIGNIHAGPARDTELYFAESYPDEDWLPVREFNGQRLELLHRDEWNVRYVAGYLRKYADIRTGKRGPHHNLTDTDMEMIFTAYHADLAYCFARDEGGNDTTQSYQEATFSRRSECQVFAEQLTPLLNMYRKYLKR